MHAFVARRGGASAALRSCSWRFQSLAVVRPFSTLPGGAENDPAFKAAADSGEWPPPPKVPYPPPPPIPAETGTRIEAVIWGGVRPKYKNPDPLYLHRTVYPPQKMLLYKQYEDILGKSEWVLPFFSVLPQAQVDKIKADLVKTTNIRFKEATLGVVRAVCRKSFGGKLAKAQGLFVGPVSLVYCQNPDTSLAELSKLLKLSTTKANKGKLIFMGGIFQGAPVDFQELETLDKMTHVDQAKFGLIQMLTQHSTQLIRVLQSPSNNLIKVLAFQSNPRGDEAPKQAADGAAAS